MVLSDANNYYSTEKVIQQKSAVSKRIATQRDDGPLHVNISNCYDYCPRIMARTEDLLYWMEHCQVYCTSNNVTGPWTKGISSVKDAAHLGGATRIFAGNEVRLQFSTHLLTPVRVEVNGTWDSN